MKNLSIKLSYDELKGIETEIELFDRDKYLEDLRKCETFEEFINTLTKEDYDDLARAGDMNYLEYPEHY